MNGKVASLPRAKKLPMLSWDEDLSVLAMRVTNQCQDKPQGFCVNTPRFRNVGESSDFVAVTNGFFPDMIVFTEKWISAANQLSTEDVNSFPQNPDSTVVAAANLLNQKNVYIGCGMLSATGKMFATCLFSHKVISGAKLYKTIPKRGGLLERSLGNRKLKLRSKSNGKSKDRSKQSSPQTPPPKKESSQNTSETPSTPPQFNLRSLIKK